MSRRTITISDDDIARAELILLRKGQAFDPEGKAFIKNLETVDLQAVPGSGKTTALLAKLLILERHLPFEDGSGILVLSHTNAAVDEIVRRIGRHCPRILTYPSFIGTIQGFVDCFLALPYYAQKHAKRAHRVDNDIYRNGHCIPRRAQGWLNNRPDKENIVYASRLLGSDALGYDIMGDGSDFPLRDKNSQTYQALLTMKTALREDGVLSFEDAYVLAREYTCEYKQITSFLRNRFRFVLVDEMQDMDHHQYGLLEDLFWNSGRSGCAYQRIGDKNQAIYSHEVKIVKIWTDRGSPLRLTGSQRLSPHVAEVVAPFATTPTAIEGKNVAVGTASQSDLLPHVIVFDDASADAVIPKFCELINAHTVAGRIPQYPEHPIKAIAWVKDERGLRRYWGEYQAEVVKAKTHHSCLRDYVIFARQEDWRGNGLGPIHKKVMDALLRVLHMEGIRNPDSKSGYFSMRSFHRFLREMNSDRYDALRLKCLSWSRDVHAGRIDQVYDDIRGYVPLLLRAFDKQLTNAVDFVAGEAPATASDCTDGGEGPNDGDNIYRCPTTGIAVQVGTVHSAKGETHMATLYLESYYYNDGGKSYESQRLQDQCKGVPLSSGAGKRVKQSARMVYVGFSRPTHLLCFAVHKDRFNEDAFPAGRWEVVRVC